MKVTVAEALVQTLHLCGVRNVFGVSGGYTSMVLDALSRSEIRTIRCMHEGAAAFAAAAYSQASGELAVTFSNSGPGTTNLVTGVAAAYMDGVPMLVLATQAPNSQYAQESAQESRGFGRMLDQSEMFRTISGAIFRPPNAEGGMRAIRQAIALARADRTPTVIDLPIDVSSAQVEVDVATMDKYFTRSEGVDHDAVAITALRLASASSPVILIGDKMAHRGCTAELARLCEEHDIVGVSADFAKGVLPEDHPLYAGVLGQSGHESAAELVRGADVVLALGARLSVQTSIGFERGLFKGLIQIDERASELGRHYPVELGAVSHLPGFVKALRQALGPAGGDRGQRARVATLRAEHAVYGEEITRRAEMNTPTALRVLRAGLPRETLVTGDCGLNLQYLKRHFPIFAPDGFFNLYGLAAMGAGLPLAIGVKLARQMSPVVSIIGDGGLMVYPGELAVAAELGISVITVVMNNDGYRQVGDRLQNYFGTRNGCTMPRIDFAALAKSMGVAAQRAHDEQTLARAIDWALEVKGPSLIEVTSKGDDLYDMTLPATRAVQDAIFKRVPLRPPWPFEK